MNTKRDYFEGYETVYCLNYCTGEVGSLVWHTKGIYKNKSEAKKAKKLFKLKIKASKKELLKLYIRKIRGIEKNENDFTRFVMLNGDFYITNVVVTPYRLEDTKI